MKSLLLTIKEILIEIVMCDKDIDFWEIENEQGTLVHYCNQYVQDPPQIDEPVIMIGNIVLPVNNIDHCEAPSINIVTVKRDKDDGKFGFRIATTNDVTTVNSMIREIPGLKPGLRIIALDQTETPEQYQLLIDYLRSHDPARSN
jgi:hypothetical protein